MGSANKRIQGRDKAAPKASVAETLPLSASSLLRYTFPVCSDSRCARLRKSRGAYVSGTTRVCTSQITPVKMARKPCTRLQPTFSLMNPPRTGPCTVSTAH